MTTTDSQVGAAIDTDRLDADLQSLGLIGGLADGGVERLAFSAADLAARDWIERRMVAAGMDVRRDEIGNTIGTYAGTEEAAAPIALGSHTDTVPGGGIYDGALGVLAALACVEALAAVGKRLSHPVEVINFVAEEATCGGGLLGSRAMTGRLPGQIGTHPAWGGSTVGKRLAAAGIDIARIGGARRAPGSLAAFLELHIEQGPLLEQAGAQIGIVESIVGVRTFSIRFAGLAGHAGTTPMDGRRDALVDAARFVAEVPGIAGRHGVVATVGRLEVRPGAPNVIPGLVEATLDLRSASDRSADAAEAELRALALELGAGWAADSRVEPVRLSEDLLMRTMAVARRHGLTTLRLPSAAGHDTMQVASIADAAMIFVPSRGGISHRRDEYTAPASCHAGAEVLLDTLVDIDIAACDRCKEGGK
ncbi:MAG: Zn-dependent hydrolase [Solirubrobacterales bacterium]